MSETVTLQINVDSPWSGAPDWPQASELAEGQTEGCWLVGLPSLSLTLDRDVAPKGPVTVVRGGAAPDQPYLSKILALPGVEAVMASGQSITVSARPEGGWDELGGQIEAVVREHFEANEAEIRRKVTEALDAEINPGVAMHGGFIELLDVRGTTIYIKMGGGCQGCGMASVTLKQGVERTIREHVPEVTQILDTTDHASGDNPYYAPAEK